MGLFKKRSCTVCLGGKKVRQAVTGKDGKIIGYKMVNCGNCGGSGTERA